MMSFNQIFTFSDAWSFIAAIFCLPGNLIIEFLATRTSLASSIQWSTDPTTLINSWSAACGSAVVWILLFAIIAQLTRPSAPSQS